MLTHRNEFGCGKWTTLFLFFSLNAPSPLLAGTDCSWYTTNHPGQLYCRGGRLLLPTFREQGRALVSPFNLFKVMANLKGRGEIGPQQEEGVKVGPPCYEIRFLWMSPTLSPKVGQSEGAGKWPGSRRRTEIVYRSKSARRGWKIIFDKMNSDRTPAMLH